MMRQMIIVAALAILFSASVFAGSQGMGKGMGAGAGPLYRNLDADGNGYISKQELQAQDRLMKRMTKNWKQADTNKDGKVDISEFSAFEAKEMKQEQEQHQMQNREGQEDMSD
jgi:hypothetical protein